MSAELDNPVFAALSGPHAPFALRGGRALRYPPDVSPFMGLPRPSRPEDWDGARALVPSGEFAGVLGGDGASESGWQVVRSFPVLQMTGAGAAGGTEPDAVVLSAGDVPEMLELVRRTDPGPFLPRTIELGRYLGIRRGGTLVAMAGERLRLPGHTEISAVCTLPDHRGRGLAGRLIGALVAGIRERGEQPFLHVVPSNTGAIGLYRALGFTVRHEAQIAIVRQAP